MPGCRGASLGGRGEDGTVGARIGGSGSWVEGPWGPIPSGGGGGVATRNTGLERASGLVRLSILGPFATVFEETSMRQAGF